MEKKIGLGIGLFFLLFLIPTGLYAGEYLTREEALKIAFPQADGLEKRAAIVSKEQKEKIKSLITTRKGSPTLKRVSSTFIYYEGIKDGKVIGYAVIKNVLGRERFFTFMVAVNPQGKIKMVEILAYQESYGSGVKQKRFLQQFIGKTIEDHLRLNSDIDAITGATISCRSVTEGVRESLAYLSVLVPLETTSQSP